jgi:phosphate transport system substrate-binding protein
MLTNNVSKVKLLFLYFSTLFLVIFVATACAQKEENPEKTEKLSGTIEIDGSSTVFPITQAVAEEFMKYQPSVRIPVGVSGTGGGMKRFIAGETSISDASRSMKDEEAEKAAENKINWTELTVAYDGLSIVVNNSNTWIECLAVDQLNQIWRTDNPALKWNEVDPSWPDKKISLYGPGTDSGTFDYFTLVINGEVGASRADYTASEDDNILVQGVAGDKNSLGYFGYAYYTVNKDKVRIVKIDGGNGCIEPNLSTIAEDSYTPLARPIFIYVNNAELKRPEVAAFVTFYLTEGAQYVSEVGYIPIGKQNYEKELMSIHDYLP